MSIDRVTALLLVSLIALPVEAQERIRFGVKLGVTSAELRTGDEEGPLSGGFNAGVFVAVPVYGPLSALASADYYGKGTGRGLDPHHTSLLVASQCRSELSSSSAALYGFAGPRLDLLIGNRIGKNDWSEDQNAGPTSPEEFNAAVFGASAGVGVELKESVAGPLLLELRYDLDATPIQSFPWGDRRFRRWSLRLGFSL